MTRDYALISVSSKIQNLIGWTQSITCVYICVLWDILLTTHQNLVNNHVLLELTQIIQLVDVFSAVQSVHHLLLLSITQANLFVPTVAQQDYLLINLLEVVSLNVLLSQFITFMQILQIVAKSSVYIHILVRFNLNSVLLNAKIAFMEILLQKNVKLVELNA